MDKKREKILRKIHALQDKTVASGCTEEEVQAAIEVMNQLMTEYNLTIEDIQEEYFDFNEDYVWSSSGTTNNNPVKFCMWALGEFCEVRVWLGKRWDTENRQQRHATTFFGEKRDVELAKYLFHVINNSVHREAERFKNYDMNYFFGDRNQKTNIIKSFKIGMTKRIAERMMEMVRERSKVMNENQKSGIIVYKKGAIDQELEKLNMKFSKGAKSKIGYIDDNAYSSGKQAGNKVHLGHGVAGSKNSAKMLGA